MNTKAQFKTATDIIACARNFISLTPRVIGNSATEAVRQDARFDGEMRVHEQG
ncbi:MAG: hypothetical protein WCB49_08055 [Gammaproteobacteria bacterium]